MILLKLAVKTFLYDNYRLNIGGKVRKRLNSMHLNQGPLPGDRDAGASSISGTLLMIALFVVAASVVVYALVSINAPQNLARTSMRILAPNSSTLVVTSMVGDSIPINNINIIVGPDTYNASGIEDTNHNGRWDPGETIFLFGLDLSDQTSVVVTSDATVLMPGTVGGSYDLPTPPSAVTPAAGGTSTWYHPGIHMYTFSDPGFTGPVTSLIAESISFADPAAVAAGYRTNDPAWPTGVAGKAHDFSVKFQGYLYVDDNATYDLSVTATDSTDVIIDGIPIMSNTGEHAPYKMIDSTYLTMGYHRLEIGYENFDDNCALIGDLNIRKEPGGAWEQPGLYYLEGVAT